MHGAVSRLVLVGILGWWMAAGAPRGEAAPLAKVSPARLAAAAASAFCPFCSAVNMTFAEQMKTNDVVVIARLLEAPKPVTNVDDELPKAQLEVIRVFKGERFIQSGTRFEALLVGAYPADQEFLVMGVDPPFLVWSTPMKSTPRLVEYLEAIQELPDKGPDRLVFFQEYFEDAESALAFDAYDEFATSTYEDLIAMKDRMDRPKLLKYIQDPEVPTNRRRLYFTMLGVCGQPDDIEVLEQLITSEDRNQRAGLDALVACYLSLKGADGLPLIEKEFLSNEEVDFVDTLAAVSSIRFHGTEATIIPRERLVASIRLILERPKLADMVIPDLARWEDWSVMDRLVTMFKEAEPQNNWLRVPIIQYLMACPLPAAKERLEELRQIDPEAVRRASFFSDFGFGDGSEQPTAKSPAAEPVDATAGKGAALTGEVQVVLRPSLPEFGPDEPAPEDLGSDDGLVGTPLEPLESFPAEPTRSKNVEETGSLRVGTPSVGRSMALEPAPPRVDRPEFVSRPASESRENPNQSPSPRLWWAVVPIAVSGVMFALIWSVINGWFLRLLY